MFRTADTPPQMQLEQLASSYDVVVTTYSTVVADEARPLERILWVSVAVHPWRASGKGVGGLGFRRQTVGPQGGGMDLASHETGWPPPWPPPRLHWLNTHTPAPCHPQLQHRVVFDEGHALRNRATAQTQACAALRSWRRWIVTGTPWGSSIGELEGQLVALQLWPFSDSAFFRVAVKVGLPNFDVACALRRSVLLPPYCAPTLIWCPASLKPKCTASPNPFFRNAPSPFVPPIIHSQRY